MKSYINVLINIIFVLALSYFISTILFIFLKPLPLYYFPFKHQFMFFDLSLENHLFLHPIKKKTIKKEINYIKDFKLIGIYFDGKKGFVIIKDKNKSVFIDLNKFYKGYKLIKINSDNVIFVKNGKKYILYLTSKKSKNNLHTKKNISKLIYPKKIMNRVQRSLVNFYKNNISVIWQNIRLVKVSNGYKITYIQPNSIFTKLGLRRGDILIEVNGRRLLNDSDAWDLYQNLNKFDEIRVKILRNNKEKVLKYEIY